MALGKSSPALFELIRDKGSAMQGPQVPRAGPSKPEANADAAAPEPPPPAPPSPAPATAKPHIRLQLTPAPEPRLSVGVAEPMREPVLRKQPAPRPVENAPHSSAPPPSRPGPFLPASLPMNAIFLGVAGVIVAGVILWTVAYRLGSSQTDSEWKQKFAAEPGSSVRDPLRAEVGVNPGLVKTPPATPDRAQRPRPEQARPTPDRTSQAGVPALSGVDPRSAGLNYLQLAAFLDQATAERLVAFLGEGGLPAFATPIDPKGGPAKNPGLFKVYASAGIAGKDIRAGTQEVRDLKDLARRLGAAWKRDQKGSTDFDDMFWEKHTP